MHLLILFTFPSLFLFPSDALKFLKYKESLRDMLRFANAAAYLVTTKKGAIKSMPEVTDVEKILRLND